MTLSSYPSGLVAVVFGASSGIGRATAIRLAGRGETLLLVSRSPSALAEAALECRAAGAADVAVATADVNDAAAVEHAVEDAARRWGRVDVVVHSATVMAYGRFEDLPPDVFTQVVDTAIHGTANVCRAVLARFREQRHGHLVVVSSLLASIAAPTMGAYVTGKWGQLGLLRTLQIETRDLPHVHISTVSPGGVSTPIYYQAATYAGTTGTPPPPVYSSDRVARDILARLGRPRRVSQSGVLNPLAILGFRLLPGVFDALVGPLLRLAGLANDDAGPTTGNVFEPRPELEAAAGPWRGL